MLNFNDPVAINNWEVVIGPTMADTLEQIWPIYQI